MSFLKLAGLYDIIISENKKLFIKVTTTYNLEKKWPTRR